MPRTAYQYRALSNPLDVDATAEDLIRFARMIRVGDIPDGFATPCHEWQGCRDKDGYPQFKYGGRKIKAHRWIVAARVRPLEAGEDVDHACRNVACVNDDHLRPASPYDNRGWRRNEPADAVPMDDVPF